MPVRVGVVGCGWWSTTAHLPALAADPRAQLVAVADSDPGKRERATDRFGVPRAFATWEALLAEVEVDALVVATPAAHHFAPARAALSRGLSVLVEKPMVLTPEEARELASAESASAGQLAVGYTFHHTSTAAAVRAAIQSGRIGAVEHVSSTFASTMRALLGGAPAAYSDGSTGFAMAEVPDPATYSVLAAGGGQALSQLTHSVALALHLTDLVPDAVCATIARFGLAVDVADAVGVAFTSGALGSFDSVGTIQPGHQELLQVRVFGTEGHVVFDAIAGAAQIHEPGGRTASLPPLDDPYPVAAPARNLVDLALGDGVNLAPVELGSRVVHLLDAALRSAATGRREPAEATLGSPGSEG